MISALQLGLVALYDLWKKTTGTLSLDLKRRQFKGGAPGDSLWRLQPAAEGGGGGGPRGRRRRGSDRGLGMDTGRCAGAALLCCLDGAVVCLLSPPPALCSCPAAACSTGVLHPRPVPHCRGRPPARAQPTYFGQPPPPSGTYATGGRGAYSGGYAAGGGGYAAGGSGGGGDLFDLPSMSFMDTGARIKVMRHVQVSASMVHLT